MQYFKLISFYINLSKLNHILNASFLVCISLFTYRIIYAFIFWRVQIRINVSRKSNTFILLKQFLFLSVTTTFSTRIQGPIKKSNMYIYTFHFLWLEWLILTVFKTLLGYFMSTCYRITLIIHSNLDFFFV